MIPPWAQPWLEPLSVEAPGMEAAVLATYYLVLGILALYGIHRLVLVGRYLRYRRRARVTPPDPQVWPRVTVQLPLYNEMYVARRLVDAVCRLDYPKDRLEIQVLDDSTDETQEIAREAVETYRAEGFDIHLLHRSNREGYKAGALAAGQQQASGELVAVFDADFLPRRGFLKSSVPHFQDPEIGMVQARWEHLNRNYSLLTRIQAIFLDGHFVIEHSARNLSGCFFNFNGTAGIWRRRTIEEAGGWQHDTLTEDLDLSYRAQLRGWRFLYLPEVTVPSELPVDIHGFKSQQHRWAKGSVQTGRKLLGTILRSPLPWKVKAEAVVHLTNNMAYLLMLMLTLLVFPAMVIRHRLGVDRLLWLDLALFAAATGSVLLFYVTSQTARKPSRWRQVLFLPALMGIGMGLSVNNARAVLGGCFQRGGVFVRTPKYRIDETTRSDKSGDAKGDWKKKRYRAKTSSSYLIEGLLALYLLTCTVAALALRMWFWLPFLYLFFHGYAYVFLLSVAPAWRRRRGVDLLASSAG